MLQDDIALHYTCSIYWTSKVDAMQVISYSQARNSLKSVLDSVNDNADVTIINRRDAGNAVVMSLDHYNSIMETLYLMQSPANAAYLMESIAQFKASKATIKQLVKD